MEAFGLVIVTPPPATATVEVLLILAAKRGIGRQCEPGGAVCVNSLHLGRTTVCWRGWQPFRQLLQPVDEITRQPGQKREGDDDV